MKRNIRVGAIGLVFLLGVGCEKDERRLSNEYKFVEYVAVAGECQEDHIERIARNRGKYSGSLVHWYIQKKNLHMRYGSVVNKNQGENLRDEIRNPDQYYPPYSVTFDYIPKSEFDSDRMKISGRAIHLKSEGYKTTCDLTVIRRLDHIPADGNQ
jgi:hypothetical protein